MATINTDLVLASVPDVDIAGAIAGGISSYYGVKEMQDAQAERDMLLEQRENELWSSNYNRWKEWGNFVDPANADDYIAKGMEMGVYDQDTADMMLEQLQGVRATGLPKLQHDLDTAMGVQAKSDALMAERQQLEDEMAQVGGMQTPTAYARQQQLSSRASEIDAEMQNLSGQLETFDIPSLQEQHQAAYDTSMASVQSAMNMWRGLGDAYEAFNAGEPYEMYKFNEETGQIETTNVTSEEELEARGDEGWEVTSPELGTYYDTDANAHIGTPQMAYRKGWSEDEPTVTADDTGFTMKVAVAEGETEEQYVKFMDDGTVEYTDVYTGDVSEGEAKRLASVGGMDLKEAPNPETGVEEFVYIAAGQEPVWSGIPTGQLTGQKAAALNMIMDDIVMRSTFSKMEPEDKMRVLSDAQFIIESADPELQIVVQGYMDKYDEEYKAAYPDKVKFLQAIISKYKEAL